MPATITTTRTSIFHAPATSILIHACNAKGSWGAGVALAFKTHYPSAFQIYRAHCNPAHAKSNCALRSHQQELVGTTLLIPPQAGDGGGGHWVACLFTSYGFGKGVATPEEILVATGKAWGDLEGQIGALRVEALERGEREGEGESAVVGVGECWAVKINSGKFGVEWGRTKKILEEGGLDVRVVDVDFKGEGERDGDVIRRGNDEKGEEEKGKRKRGKDGESVEVEEEEKEVVVKRDKKGRASGEGLMKSWLKQR